MPSSTHPRVRRSLAAVLRASLLALAASATVAAFPASAAIVRTFHFAPHEVSVLPSTTGARITLVGGAPMGEAGEPETPAVPAYVAIPDGERVVGVTFEAAGWVAVPSDAGRIRAAAAPSPGFPVRGSEPDAALYARDAWFPATAGVAGPGGGLRGRNLASFALRPVRVRPASGAVEVATSITVRIDTEADRSPDRSVRKRVVAEWEEEFARTTARAGRGLELEALRPAWSAGTRVESARTTGTQAGGGGFTPTVVPSVEGSPVQYLIITNNAMQSEMQRLAEWRTRTGVPTVVRTVEFIQANYPYGFDLQDRIRRFIREAYEQWGVTHVLLGGDTDVIPPRYGRTTFFGGAYIPTDLYYSDLDGNWNADGDSLFGEAYQEMSVPGDELSLFPDVYVGRAPVTSLAQAQVFVDKVLQYSRTPVGDYENKALFAGEVLFPQEYVPPMSISLDGAEDCESAISRLTPEMQVLRLYENWPAYDSVDALPETRQRVLDSLGVGRGLFHHVGHGYRNSMSVGDAAVTNPDAEALNNGDRLFWLYSINCTSNAIDFASLGEAFVLNPNGGAVANIGSTREDFPVTGRSYQDEFYDLVFQDKVATVGEAFARQKFPFIGLAFYDNTHRWTQFTLALLGDPAMPLYWRKPPTLAVTAPANVPLSDTTFIVHVTSGGNPVAGARVCLMKAGEEYEVVATDAGGDAVMHVRPETPGSAFLTVSAPSSRPFEGTVNFTASAGIVLVQKAADRTIDDDNVGGTIGAGDGAADAGERVDWLLPITNSGGAPAGSVTASLSTASPHVTVLTAAATYGSIFGGLTVPGTPYRLQVAENVPDGTEVEFRLDIFSGAAHWVDTFRLPIRSPNLVHFANTVVDNGSNGTIGNSNGRLDIGETVDVSVSLRNVTTGTARAVAATLATSTPGVSVVSGNATIGDVPANTSATSTNFRVVNTSASDPRFTLTVSDAYGVRYVQSMDMVIPGGVTGLVGTGAASSITLVWKKSASADLAGYNVYRSTAQAGPFTRLNAVPTDRTAVYVDEALPSLTRFYYQVSAVDSSGNESAKSAVSSASTNPPLAANFPLVTERNMPSSPVIGNIDNSSDSSYEIIAGSNVLWAWHADGTALLDADGTERTSGDFTTQGSYYAAGATIADLDLDGTWEIIAPTWDDKKLYVYRADGTNFPGFPVTTGASTWSTAAVGNIDADAQLEIVFGSNDPKFFAYNHDGTEVRDGDANPGTIGIFKTLGTSSFNYASPALADLDHDGRLDIIMVTFDGLIHAWRGDGTNLPGFPVNMFAAGTSSAAVGNIDGDAGLEIAVTSSGGKLWVLQENGTNQPGFPIINLVTNGTSKASSPALADMDGDGQRDVVINTTDGLVKVYKGTGALIPAWTNVRYGTVAGASESSPVVADIDGDGQNEVLVGGEDANLSAFDNDGTLMAGFPIHLNGEIRGTPTVWDIDHDGKTEILVSCWDKNVYMWNYDNPFNPNGAPAWAMWRHDNLHQGRADAPIVVSTEAVAFAAEDGATSGLRLTFMLPLTATSAGRFDVYRASGPGATGATVAQLPPDFARVSHEPLAGTPGALLEYADGSALPGGTYRYLLVRRSESAGESFLAFGPFAATASAQAPALAFLGQTFPNPMRAGGHATIAYGVPGAGEDPVRTTVKLYDVRGRLVRSIVDQLVPPGRYQATWDGRDTQGARVAAGVYFYEFVVGGERLRRKALVLGE
jgi:hypothetical protein